MLSSCYGSGEYYTKLRTVKPLANTLQEAGFYKPYATRLPVLSFLLVSTLALIGLLELSCRAIPAHSGIGSLDVFVNTSLWKDIEERDVCRL